MRSSHDDRRGILCGASRAAQNCRTASDVHARRRPATRQATICCPRARSGAPSTRTSATPRHRPQHPLDFLRLHLSSGDVDERRDPSGQRRGRRRSSNRPKSPVRNPPSDERAVGPVVAGVAGRHRRAGDVDAPAARRGAFLGPQRDRARPAAARPTRRLVRQLVAVVVGDAAGFAGAVERVNLHAERVEEAPDGGRSRAGRRR